MDMKEQDRELASPGAMFPGAPLAGPQIELTTPVASYDTVVDGAVVISEAEIQQKEQKSPTPLQDSLRRLRRDIRAMASVGVVLLFVLIAIIGPPIYQHIGGDYNSPLNGQVPSTVYHTFYHQELTRTDEGPSAQYWLGTDDLGRDLLARLMQGMLISLSVAILVEVVDISLGIHLRLPRDTFPDSPHRYLRRPGRCCLQQCAGDWAKWKCPPVACFRSVSINSLAPDGTLRAWANAATQTAAVCGGSTYRRHQQYPHYPAAHYTEPVQHRGRRLNAQHCGYDCRGSRYQPAWPGCTTARLQHWPHDSPGGGPCGYPPVGNSASLDCAGDYRGSIFLPWRWLARCF